jgi:hypothetical protein
VLLKSRGAALVSVLALALGIGANVSCFITVNALVLHPLPYPALDRIVTLGETVSTVPEQPEPVAAGNFFDWRTGSRAFQRMAAFRPWDATLTGGGDPERIQGCLASADFFDLLGLRPVMGRALSAADSDPGQDGVVVVSQGFWRSRMAAAPDALGRTLTLGGRGGSRSPAFTP